MKKAVSFNGKLDFILFIVFISIYFINNSEQFIQGMKDALTLLFK